jgi:APA family basic amino acid/polyamine antiporter
MDLFRKKAFNRHLDDSDTLLRCLSAFDLTFLGVGAIIGAGIFILTGVVAATHSGPGIIFSYIIAGLACGFTALSYAELATAIGGCGSAYSYAYVGFGEIIAWIVGWDLLLEYAVSVSTVAVGWSGYFNSLLVSLNVHLPSHLLQDPVHGGSVNILAFSIIILLSFLLTLGAKSSSRANNLIVLIKLGVILLFIVMAIRDVKPQNWFPLLPFGWSGVTKGASLIFFAYIGFDAVSTAAEEVKNPQRNVPRGLLGALFICTFLYILVSGILTGVVPYGQLNVASPLSYALILLGHKTMAGVISFGALAGLTTVMITMFYGLSRVFLAMARDGLLPKYFAAVGQQNRSPVRIIFLCGGIMAVLAALIPMRDLAELVNVGTLFAFSIVCAGVIVLRYTQPNLPRPFKTPGMPYIPLCGLLTCLYLVTQLEWYTLLRFVIWFLIGLIIYFCTIPKYNNSPT